MMKMFRALAAALSASLVLALMGAPLAGVAQTWPERPIKLVLPYSAGGPTDVVARIIAEHLGVQLKQPVVVENIAGASGMIGSKAVANAAPDGYTLLFAVADTNSINPHIFSNMGYDAQRDFTPVALTGNNPAAIIVRPGLPATDVKSFLKLARESPKRLTYASWGIGSSGHIRMEMLREWGGVELLHVPYPGSAPAISALMGGHVDAMLVPLTVAAQQHQAGKVRIIGVSTPARIPAAPDAQTFVEQGIPIDITVWLGILAPAKTPEAVVATLNRGINAVLQDPQARATLTKAGMQVAAPNSPQDFGHFLAQEYTRWGKTIKDAGIKPQ